MDRQPLHLRLRDHQAVKRITMVPRQRNQRAVVFGRGRQELETVGVQHAGKERVETHLKIELAERNLDRHFPRRRVTHIALVRCILHRSARRSTEGGIPLAKPEQRVRVEKQPHPM